MHFWYVWGHQNKSYVINWRRSCVSIFYYHVMSSKMVVMNTSDFFVFVLQKYSWTCKCSVIKSDPNLNVFLSQWILFSMDSKNLLSVIVWSLGPGVCFEKVLYGMTLFNLCLEVAEDHWKGSKAAISFGSDEASNFEGYSAGIIRPFLYWMTKSRSRSAACNIFHIFCEKVRHLF